MDKTELLALAEELDAIVDGAILKEDIAKEIASALRRLAAAEPGEPVAYRYRFVLRNGAKLGWEYYNGPIVEHDGVEPIVEHDGVEIEKLYTSPQPAPAPDAPESGGANPLLQITYTNYRGETSVRRIEPKSLRFGSNEWHPEPQWLLLAYDTDKQAHREFALKDFGAPQADQNAERMQAQLRDKCELLDSISPDEDIGVFDASGRWISLWTVDDFRALTGADEEKSDEIRRR